MRTTGANARKLLNQAKYQILRGGDTMTSAQVAAMNQSGQTPTPSQEVETGILLYDRWWMIYDDTDFEYVDD